MSELKTIIELEDVHLAQVLNYLKAYRLKVGLLINFGSKSLTFKKTRAVRKSVKSLNPCQSVIQTVYDIVKAHGGKLTVNSHQDEGTEFIIQLPG